MKTIALIDFFSSGHHEAYMSEFVKVCLSLNTNVVCIFPNTKEISVSINQSITENHKNIIFVDHQPVVKKYKDFGRFNSALTALQYWKNSSAILRETEKKHKIKIDLVFFNWLDGQIANYLFSPIINFVFPYKWTGLYLHPLIFRVAPKYLESKATFRDIDAAFLSKNCVAVTLLDGYIAEKYTSRIKKKAIAFPDIADLTPPDINYPLAKKIKLNANGRIIVGIIGLDPHKGTYELIQLAKKADVTKYYFVFTGWFFQKHFENHEQNKLDELTDFINNTPEHCLWETGALTEGEEYNSVFCSFDIVHLLYKDHYGSSNRLTKAAYFNKLVLSNNYGCVGDEVKKYDLGETADQNDITEQLQKLELLRNKFLQKNFPYAGWELYFKKHSKERLKEKFEELLNLV